LTFPSITAPVTCGSMPFRSPATTADWMIHYGGLASNVGAQARPSHRVPALDARSRSNRAGSRSHRGATSMVGISLRNQPAVSYSGVVRFV
jgi:hypothetical protein